MNFDYKQKKREKIGLHTRCNHDKSIFSHLTLKQSSKKSKFWDWDKLKDSTALDLHSLLNSLPCCLVKSIFLLQFLSAWAESTKSCNLEILTSLDSIDLIWIYSQEISAMYLIPPLTAFLQFCPKNVNLTFATKALIMYMVNV